MDIMDRRITDSQKSTQDSYIDQEEEYQMTKRNTLSGFVPHSRISVY